MPKFETKLIEDRWKEIQKKGKQKSSVLISVITSEANAHCQSAWIGHVFYLAGYFDIVIFENSDTIDNLEKFKFVSHNYSNIIIKKGKVGQKKSMDKIVENRNMVLSYIRKYTGYDYIIMLDSDIFPPVNLIPEFLKRKDLDVQCSLCSVMKEGEGSRPALNFFPEDNVNGRALKWLTERKPRLVKIAQSGLGCVMIKAGILRKHKNITFVKKITRKNGTVSCNEDLNFTNQIRELGYDLWLDLKMESPHHMKKRA